MNIEELNKVLLGWRGFFEELNLPFIIYQSMCLGLIRNGTFLPERVAEFGVLYDDVLPHLDKLKTDPKYGFDHENEHLAPAGLMYFNNAEIQIVTFKNGKAVYNLYKHQCLVFDEDLLKRENWTTYRYLGLDWKLPGWPERYLEQAYGKDWRTPYPTYHWQKDAPNLVGWDEI